MSPFLFIFCFIIIWNVMSLFGFKANGLMSFIMKIALILIWFSPVDYMDGLHVDKEADNSYRISYSSNNETLIENNTCTTIKQVCENNGRICHSETVACGG